MLPLREIALQEKEDLVDKEAEGLAAVDKEAAGLAADRETEGLADPEQTLQWLLVKTIRMRRRAQ